MDLFISGEAEHSCIALGLMPSTPLPRSARLHRPPPQPPLSPRIQGSSFPLTSPMTLRTLWVFSVILFMVTSSVEMGE